MYWMQQLAEHTSRLATAERARFVSITFTVIAGLVLAVSFGTARNRVTVFGPSLGADFACFYVAGLILNFESPGQLYDMQLQSRLYHDLLPGESETSLPYPYAPFLAVVTVPLALLPYEQAYLAWLCINLACYLYAFTMVWKQTLRLGESGFRDARLIALSFAPFLLEGWIGGQAVGLCILVIACVLYLQSRGHRVLGGVVLAIVSFKPTLLVAVVPMLCVTRQFRILTGFAVGTLLLGLFSLALVGRQGCWGYLEMLHHYAEVKAIAPDVFKTWKYIDANSFVRLAFGNHRLGLVIWGIISGVIWLLLLRAWWPLRGDYRDSRRLLAWALALCWTPILTPQCAIYDATLLVPSVLVTISVLRHSTSGTNTRLTPTLHAMLACLYLTPWFSQFIAVRLGIQPMTLAVSAFGAYLLALAEQGRSACIARPTDDGVCAA